MAKSAWLNPDGRPLAILKGVVIAAVGLWLIFSPRKPAEEGQHNRIDSNEAAGVVGKQFPGSQVRQIEANREQGLLVYEVTMADGRKQEVQVNTQTGQIEKIESE